jgi:hypothetical protein
MSFIVELIFFKEESNNERTKNKTVPVITKRRVTSKGQKMKLQEHIMEVERKKKLRKKVKVTF